MRYVQINSFYNGSTGTIMKNLHKQLTVEGHDSYIFWGRRHKTINDHEERCASSLSVYVHGMMARLTDRIGFYSKRDTVKLLKRLDEINPDVVHLHNIHGYYINIEMLFEWLFSHDCQVKWTLHDCWAFTGHCAYFSYVDCNLWKTGCGLSHRCPQKREYPKSFLFDNSKKNYKFKEGLFTSVPRERMLLITPSEWLAEMVQQSYLNKYRVIVKNNKIDPSIFAPNPGLFRQNYGLSDKKIILGVASPWTDRKGLGDFLQLAKVIDDSYRVVLIGLSSSQIKQLPNNVIGLKATDSIDELVAAYSSAAVLFNPSREDNYPTVNLESQACGTPVVTYDLCGSPETLNLENSVAVHFSKLEQERIVDVMNAIDTISSDESKIECER